MRLRTALSLLCSLGLATGTQRGDNSSPSQCRCTPDDACWPQDCIWQALDKKLGKGKLIKTSPVAESCYDGPNKNLEQCAYVDQMWTDQDFETSNPIGRSYPYNITCPPVNYTAGETPTTCTLGSLPYYAVNVSTRGDIFLTLEFAKRHNLRLVVSSTGHDLLGRSDGYGGLELWLHSFRNGIYFQETFESASKCTKSGWKGSAIHIDGAFQWQDVYKVAEANNVIAVGGGSVSPGAIGGWPSGGGHGPATRNYGLGADQILEAEIMLANGSIVIANHCEHTDLFRAIRGGGPGYGIVLSQHVKVYPNVDVVTAHHLAIIPRNETAENKDLLDAIATLHQQLPTLSTNGLAGYAYWFRHYPGPFIGDAHSGYTHGFWAINKTQPETETAVAPLLTALAPYQDRLLISSSFASYPSYYPFYWAESGLKQSVGTTSLQTSRLINPPAVANYTRVRAAIEVLGGAPGSEDTALAANVIMLVSGGQVFADAADPSSGLNPAWRVSPFVLLSGLGLPGKLVLSRAEREAVQHNVTFVLGAALKALAPDTGGYMNEGDGGDPGYVEAFYGVKYQGHLAVKRRYDPEGVFYCRTCVGAEAWVERPDGPLCRK